MNYFKLLNTIYDYFKNDRFTAQISEGTLDNVAIDKEDNFPLVHLNVIQSTLQDNVITYNIALMCLDIVDQSKTERENIFRGNDNTQMIHGVTELILLRFYLQGLRGDIFGDNAHIVNEPILDPIVDSRMKDLAGWSMNFDLTIPLDLSLCEEEIEELVLRITEENELRATEEGSIRAL
jgi:hypothetical protein